MRKKYWYCHARAGNVIGGGDWSKINYARLRKDIIKKKMIIRSPNSTRPWQHVLKPISGYLILARKLIIHQKIFWIMEFWARQETRKVIDCKNYNK